MNEVDTGKLALSNGGRNLPLEGLRGFLASLIVLVHVYRMGAKVGWYPEPSRGEALDQLGVYIVCIFFCVSGYLIVQSLLAKGQVGPFLRNRVVRIYPVFLALHLVIFALGPFMNYAWMGSLRTEPLAWMTSFTTNLLLLPGIFALPIAQKNAWSLSYELVFYLAAALLFVMTRNRSRLGKVLAFVLSAVLIFLRPFYVFFLSGYLTYVLLSQKRFGGRWVGWSAVPLLVAGAFLLPYSPYLAVPPVFLGFYGVVQGHGYVGKLLSKPALLYLGRISFSLYLIHPFTLDLVRRLVLHASNQAAFLDRLIFPLAGIGVTLVISEISYRGIEQHLTRRYLNRSDNDRIQGASRV